MTSPSSYDAFGTARADAVTRLNATTRTDLSVLQGAAQKLSDVVVGWRKQLAGIRSDKMISALAQSQKRAAATQGAQDAINAIDAAAKTAADDIRSAIKVSRKNALGAEVNDPTAQLLAETRKSNAWARVRMQMRGGISVQELIAEAGAAADVSTIAALREWLPAYARQESKGNAREADALWNGWRQLLDQAERPTMSAILGTCYDLEQRLNKGMGYLATSVSMVRDEVSNGNAHTLIADFDGNTVQVVTDTESVYPMSSVKHPQGR